MDFPGTCDSGRDERDEWGEAGEDPAEDVAATVFRAELIPGIPVLTPCPGKPNIFYLKMKSNTQTIH
jgi:hypothetical protein